WGAVVDFAFNLGLGRLQYSTLRKRINEENWDEAKNELMKWVYAGGKKLSGLVKRRQVEASFLNVVTM
ncbi:MAG: lysozyme, partial [Deltaproteobacteria bacterium]|nr:lysozyme [Deltaproteobacteria bacterium]